MEKQLKEHGDKVGPDVRGSIEAALNTLKEAQKGEDADQIRKAIDNLNQVGYKLGEAVYKSSAPQGGAPGAAPGAGEAQGQPGDQGKKNDDDVIDAEYEVKK